MLEQSATVVAVLKPGRVRVEMQPAGGCGGCAQGCGGGLAPVAPVMLEALAFELALATGDRVLVGVPEATLRLGLWRLYLAPLLALTGGALVGQGAGGDAGAALGTVAGLGLALAWARWRTQRQPPVGPIVIRKLS